MKKNLVELTPKKLKCVIGSCPAIFQDKETGEIYIMGQQANAVELGLHPGKQEVIVRVPKKLFQNCKNKI